MTVWKSSIGRLIRAYVTFFYIFSRLSKRLPLKLDFNWWIKNVRRNRLERYGGVVMMCFARNCINLKTQVCHKIFRIWSLSERSWCTIGFVSLNISTIIRCSEIKTTFILATLSEVPELDRHSAHCLFVIDILFSIFECFVPPKHLKVGLRFFPASRRFL